MLTVVVAVVPALTPAGSGVPKASSTLSPSSSILVWSVAVKVNDFDISPALKVKFAGTPE